jgi:hypothetical protein
MASKPSRPASVDPVAHKRLRTLQTQLGSQNLPGDVDYIDILSALVLYTSPPQAAGMLAAYWGYIAERTKAEARGEDPPTPPTWG